ncbi:TPR-like protein [Dacryopinax primogenitus]|uniref:TPR-like protein n=1 Tax=Dacryopinax primogenitus (strain DJM 731) TaxID=1858805 RepID=M5FW81_DACPD|nr:TPR-like protein [Dacryopinax primogenitus]EJT99934.1 TPR-like protein [Dacryopinax primogenitus]
MAALDVRQVVAELRQAVDDCGDRGLTTAADWASELLNAIPYSVRRYVPLRQHSPNEAGPSYPLRASTSTPIRSSNANLSAESAMEVTEDDVVPPSLDEEDDQDRIRRAQGLLGKREIRRAAEVLKGCKSGLGRFLRLYARYLMSDKYADERWNADQHNRAKWTPSPVNDQLNELINDIGSPTEPFLLFLKGILLFRAKKRAEAMEALLLSLRSYPCNWSCWIQLGHCIDSVEEFTRLQPLLPSHFTTRIFTVKMAADLYTASLDNTVETIDTLLETFPSSSFLKAQKALVFFNIQSEEAERIFDEIQETDPDRVDDMDVYSNVLYVLDKPTKLGDVARRMIKVNKDRPEVCCLVGNYHSMRGDHEKAVLYFRRALTLDKSYIAAWTLVGHEYLEMKNPQAAIEAYRRAVDVNRKDYRAWYGLGQTYELLDMFSYALHYYQRAAAIRPYDSRMWQALATCYTAMKRPLDALECLKRALMGEDADQIQLYTRIANLLDYNGDHAVATTYHRKIVAACTTANRPIADYAKSLLALAQSIADSESPEGIHEAMEWMEQVRESSCEEAGVAGDMYRKLDSLASGYAMQARGEGQQQVQSAQET